MDRINTLATAINKALEALDWNKQPQGLYQPIAYALSSGGKRIRPLLVLIGTDIFGKDIADAIPAALAIEIFHNFTLLHDDVMDNAPLRRGKPTIHTLWGDNTAILSGDEMLIEAYKQLGQLPADVLPDILRVFNQMGTEICEGQQLDVDYQTQEKISEEEYIRMIRLKTSVLLGTALQIGAIIAGATKEEQHNLYEYGVNIGLAFQIQDDMLDVYGDAATFGKTIGGDILEGKKTYAYIAACKKASDAQREKLTSLLQSQRITKEEKIERVTQLYNALGVRQECEKAVEYYTQKALTYIEPIPATDDKKLPLKNLAFSLLARKD